MQARVDEIDENNANNDRVDEGDEDESLFNDRNDENILDLVGTAYVHASRVPIMSAHDERVPIDENVPLEPRHLRGRPHVHGLTFLENVELAEQVQVLLCRGPSRLWYTMGRLHPQCLEEVD